ncbi:cyclic di-GMP phosphodiesterase YliE domain protein, partial [Shigella flexneri]|nr:cyclic di-GMP phosphodiesterase YliE domain protein [Shigella flexneri]EHH3899396.1 cyclic di-GMP phosphodiesterase YliE domain protein [Shigella flexneri]
MVKKPQQGTIFAAAQRSDSYFVKCINMLSLYEKIRLIILFLLAALSFIGLFFMINYQLVSERAVKRADSRFELIQKNVGYFFKDIERSALTLKDSLYLLKNTEEIQRAVILKMEMMP